MGAFGNYSYNPKPTTDFDKLHTVTVISNFNTEGKLIPIYFRVVNPDESEQTFKIDAIRYIKEINNRISFCCLYHNDIRQHEIILTFYVMECKWTIQP